MFIVTALLTGCSPEAEPDAAYQIDATPAADAAAGDIIEFGGHRWLVLDIQDGYALIITEGIVSIQRYHSVHGPISWTGSTIRSYLNNIFYGRFDETDRWRIRETYVLNNDNPWFGTSGGVNTYDKIFLLSLEEVVRYFGDSGELGRAGAGRRGFHDAYSEARIALDAEGLPFWWWLRSPGDLLRRAAIVNSDGGITVEGDSADRFVGGIRPALWLSLE